MEFVFFDVGCQGGLAIFSGKKLVRYSSIKLTDKKSLPPQEKVKRFYCWLKNNIPEPKQFQWVGTYEPFGKSRKTTANLSFLIGIIIIYFATAQIFLLNENDVYRHFLREMIIPVRTIKKEKTIQWANKHFQLNLEDHNIADAIIGGFYFSINNFGGKISR